MSISEAKGYIGANVTLTWLNRKGEELSAMTRIYSADFVPLYGPCLITDEGEIRLDRVVGCEVIAQLKVA